MQNKETVIDPKPDPWAPSGANNAQAASLATGATGVALMLADQPSTDIAQAIASLPDPHQTFASMAHILGYQFSASDAFTWGFILVILSLALNLYSYVVRYRYAKQMEAEYAAHEAEKDAKDRALQSAASQAGAKGFIGGDA
ncbi:MAG TPA: hypothetical protein VEW48_20745 [Thermoanaerobaculia bacterium]|nr:hypothetical protein [Thermoanaerobaculia bacterium]